MCIAMCVKYCNALLQKQPEPNHGILQAPKLQLTHTRTLSFTDTRVVLIRVIQRQLSAFLETYIRLLSMTMDVCNVGDGMSAY